MVSTTEQSDAFNSSFRNILFSNNETAFEGSVTTASNSATTLGPPQWLFSPLCTASSAVPTIFATNNSLTNFAHLKPNAFSLSIGAVPILPTFTDVMKFRCCTLHPPKPNAVKAATRERPPGCRTVFVGGIPDNATEPIVKEVFSVCGEIAVIRMSKKNFCHIRYEDVESVDKALSLSGYRMKVNDQEDAANTGRLHVDFAQARDDQHDYECKLRALQREMRHREIGENGTSSLADLRFSEYETLVLIEKLKNESLFVDAVQVLITWLEKGECRKKNCSQFYGALQTISRQMRRLQNDGNEFESEMQKAKDLYASRMQSLLKQFTLIEKVFDVVNQQKVWDQFTKAQRKNIIVWKQQIKELKNAHLEDVVSKRQEDEMDLSDDNEDNSDSQKRKRDDFDETNKKCKTIVIDSESLLSFSSNSNTDEIESTSDSVVAQESKEESEIQILQKTVQGLEYQLLMLRKQKLSDESEIQRLKSLLQEQCFQSNPSVDSKEEVNNRITRHIRDIRILSLISIYLSIHPMGASLSGICDYINFQARDMRAVTVEEVELSLRSSPELFKKTDDSKDIWQYKGFERN